MVRRKGPVLPGEGVWAENAKERVRQEPTLIDLYRTAPRSTALRTT